MSSTRSRLTHNRGSSQVPSTAPRGSIFTALRANTPSTLVVLGDSTGDGVNQWVYKFSQWLASRLPWVTTTYRWWDYSGGECYGTPRTLRTGSNGDRYAYLGITADALMKTPHVAAHNTTDLDVRLFLSTTSWTTTHARPILAAHTAGADPNYGWWFGLHSGVLKLQFFPDGTYASLVTCECSANVSTRLTDNVKAGLRVTLDVDDGSGNYVVKFYTSVDDNMSWPQLGNTITVAGATTLRAIASGSLHVAGRGLPDVTGNYYSLELRSSIDGPVLVSMDIDRLVDGATSFVDSTGYTWSFTNAANAAISPTMSGSVGLLVLNGSISGGTIGTIRDATRLPKMTPAIGATMFMTNLGHNIEAGDYPTIYQGLIDDVLARYATAEPVVMVQNPQKSGAAGYADHVTRMGQVRTLAVTRGYRYAEVFNAFLANGDYETNLMNDAAHPNPAGAQVWTNVVKNRIARGV